MSVAQTGFVFLCIVGLSACSPPVDDPAPSLVTDTGPCSDLKRVWAWSQGRSVAACGDVDFRDAIPLGDGYVMFWTPANGYADLWRLGPDERFGDGPLSAFLYESAPLGRSLTLINRQLAFEYNQATSKARAVGVLPSARGEIGALFDVEPVRPWPRALGGRKFVFLKDDALLDFEPGSGTYAIVLHEPPGGAGGLTRIERVGQRDAFRRDHHWLSIGEGRLLEWSPASRQYSVWRYDLDRLPQDVLDAEPAARGSWPELSHEHQLLPLSDTRIAIWNRALGSLDVRELRATADDPLGSKALGVSHDDRFRSLTRPFEAKTQSKVRHLVIVFSHGPSFDAHFGRYCLAEPGSAPTCESGPGCCEAAPKSLAGTAPFSLAALGDAFSPDDSRECVVRKQQAWSKGEMPATCGDARDFSCLVETESDPQPIYHRLAERGLLADRYYTSVADSWQTNFLFFATGAYTPTIAAAGEVSIASLFSSQRVPFATYVPDITYLLGQPAPGFVDPEWAHFRASTEFDYDAEHGLMAPISVLLTSPDQDASQEAGQFVSHVVDAVARSPQSDDTLLVVAPLTGSGFYDHLSPATAPSCASADVGRGLRVPLLAFGPFVEPGRVLHAELEHTSLTAFIEWNWLGKTGQLRGRDACAGDLRALLSDSAFEPSE